MRWRLIIEEFGTNIQYLAGVDNIVADAISRLLYILVDKYEPSTSKSQCHAKVLLEIVREEKKGLFPDESIKWEKRKKRI